MCADLRGLNFAVSLDAYCKTKSIVEENSEENLVLLLLFLIFDLVVIRNKFSPLWRKQASHLTGRKRPENAFVREYPHPF